MRKQVRIELSLLREPGFYVASVVILAVWAIGAVILVWAGQWP